MQLPQSGNELSHFLDKEEFVVRTLDQINKDLGGLEASEVNFNVDMEKDVLPQLVGQMAYVLVKMESRNIQQFIYRVDIKETDFLNAVSKEDDFQELAFLVIRREAQKVFLRYKFS